ncbi:diaminopimelate epimerase [Halobacteriales archaeon QS_1_68_20]|nr:MAG: diaminopimelate epimerase [Halobacteriales archaeon QS_1_68_20]
MTVPVEKWHGTGNDFLVVDAERYVPQRRPFARVHCDRENGVVPPAGTDGGTSGQVDSGRVAQADGGEGVRVDTDCGGDGRVGADGVLFLALEADYRPPRAVMTLVQPDGSTAPMCGNGARVAAAWAAQRTGADRIMLDTQAGTREARVDGRSVTVEMGTPSFDPADVPLDRDPPLVDEEVADLRVTAVNTGVPHAVAFVPDVDAVDLDAVAAPVRDHDLFPRGTNVTLASPRGHAASGEADGFDQRTYERGVEGETRSCGTGAVAVAAAARRLGLAEGDLTVAPPGGELSVSLPADGPATLTGPVERTFETDLPRPESVDSQSASGTPQSSGTASGSESAASGSETCASRSEPVGR